MTLASGLCEHHLFLICDHSELSFTESSFHEKKTNFQFFGITIIIFSFSKILILIKGVKIEDIKEKYSIDLPARFPNKIDFPAYCLHTVHRDQPPA